MKTHEIHVLLDNSIFISQEKKDFLKQNFCTFSQKKQDKYISVLRKLGDISMSQEDIENFSYYMKVWRVRKKIQTLEAGDEYVGA